MARGYIYILFNPALRSNQFKIGLTTNPPEQRARELSRATGVPQPYEVIYSVYVEDCGTAERLVHQKLNSQRIAKEFFELPLDTAVTTLNEVAAIVGRVPQEEPLAASRGQEIEFSPPVKNRSGGWAGRTRAPTGPFTFDDHLQKTDAPRQEILRHLRSAVLDLGEDVVETVTRENRVAYRRSRIFLEAKVHTDRIRILFLDIELHDPKGIVEKVPETHGWGRLKFLMYFKNADDLEYGMGFIKASYAIAK